MLTAGIALSAAVLATAQSLVLLRRLAPRRLVGDEVEYVGTARDPLWVRVPAYGVLVRALMRLAGALGVRSRRGRIRAARMGNGALAWAGVGAAVLAAGQAGGPLAAVLAALILLASVERALLSIHFWPEALLGLLLLGFTLFAEDTGPAAAVALAAVAGLAVMVRLDALALSPAAAALALAGFEGVLWPTLLGQAAGLGLSALWNWRWHGVGLPDTTLRFNLAVWRGDRAQPGLPTTALQSGASRALRNLDHELPERAPPFFASLAAMMARFATLFGRETFLRQRLLNLERNRAHYQPEPSAALSRRFGAALGWGTTGLFALSVFLLPVLPVATLVPVGFMLAAAGLVATRSRYRVTLLPTLAAGLGPALAGLATGALDWPGTWPGAGLMLGFGLYVAVWPARPEHPD